MKRPLVWFSALVFILSSCQDTKFFSADVFLKKIPVVASIISPSEDFRCYLHWSADATTGVQDTIKNASILLYENNELLGELSYQSLDNNPGANKEPGYYTLNDLVIKEGASYRIEIDIPDYGQLEARTKVPVSVAITKIEPGYLYQYTEEEYYNTQGADPIYDAQTLYLDKHFGTDEYFLFGYDFSPESYASASITDARYLGNNLFHYQNYVSFLFDDRNMLPGFSEFEISTSRFRPEFYNNTQWERTNIVLLSLHRDLYLYFNSLSKIWPEGGVVDPMPSFAYTDPNEVYSNIEGEGAGIFSSYSKSTYALQPIPFDSRP